LGGPNFAIKTCMTQLGQEQQREVRWMTLTWNSWCLDLQVEIIDPSYKLLFHTAAWILPT